MCLCCCVWDKMLSGIKHRKESDLVRYQITFSAFLVKWRSDLWLCPDGGHAVFELVGLHFVVSVPEGDLQCGHDGHNLMETCSGQSHSDARCEGHSQTQRQAADGYRIGQTGERHRTSLNQQGACLFFLLQVLSIIQLRLSQGVYQSLRKRRNCSTENLLVSLDHGSLARQARSATLNTL